MLLDDIITELQSKYIKLRSLDIAEEDIVCWRRSTGLTTVQLLDAIGAQLARGFHDRTLTFEFCDAVVNRMVSYAYEGFLAEGEAGWPKLFWQVFLAFDEGEYCHAGRPDADPVEFYTRPLVAAVVAQLRTESQE